MRHNTPDFAIEIHAKALVRRFKHHAKIEAESHAHLLKQKGDEEGHQVWLDVANRIQTLELDTDQYEK